MDACPRESKLFEDYYRLQHICPEEEFTQFIECLVVLFLHGEFQKTDLPTTFRINEADPDYEIIKKNLKTKYHFEGTVEYEGQQISCVHPIEWYEDEGAWQVGMDVYCNSRLIFIVRSCERLRHSRNFINT